MFFRSQQVLPQRPYRFSRAYQQVIADLASWLLLFYHLHRALKSCLALETFGPLVTVGKFSTLDEAIDLANGHGYGLSSAIYTNDPQNVWRFREGISAGMVSINNSTSGAEAHLPFGGNGLSGNGSRQSGIWVLDQFTRWQSMNWDWSNKLQKAQMDLIEIKHDPNFLLDI